MMLFVLSVLHSVGNQRDVGLRRVREGKRVRLTEMSYASSSSSYTTLILVSHPLPDLWRMLSCLILCVGLLLLLLRLVASSHYTKVP